MDLNDLIRQIVTIVRELLARARLTTQDKEMHFYIQNNVTTLTSLVEQLGAEMGGGLEASDFLNCTKNLLVIILQILVARKSKQDVYELEQFLNEVVFEWRKKLQIFIDFVVEFQKKNKDGSPLTTCQWRLWSFYNLLKTEKDKLEEGQLTPHDSTLLVGNILNSLKQVLQGGDSFPTQILLESVSQESDSETTTFEESETIPNTIPSPNPPSLIITPSLQDPPSTEKQEVEPLSPQANGSQPQETASLASSVTTKPSVNIPSARASRDHSPTRRRERSRNRHSLAEESPWNQMGRSGVSKTSSVSRLVVKASSRTMSGDQSVKGKRNQKEMIMSPPLKRRGFVLSEILSTERSYVSGLSIILNVYQKPAVEGFFITQEDIDKIILPIVETIYALHQNLLKSLEERIGDLHGTDDPLVAEIFESFIPVVVPLYSAYLLNFDLATTQLKKLRESFHLFDAFLKVQKQTELAHKKDLDSYLITIVQRLPRYVLLFKELVQNTPKSHVEYNRLVKLYQRIQETVSTIDHEKKKSQQKDESIRLHIMFGLEKEMPQTRTLVYAAELSITRDKRGHRSKHPMFIKPLNSRKFRLLLFNDIIMLARYVKDDGEELVLVKRYQLLETTINTYIMEDSDNTAIKFANSIYYTPNANARDELLDAYAQLMASYAQIFGHL